MDTGIFIARVSSYLIIRNVHIVAPQKNLSEIYDYRGIWILDSPNLHVTIENVTIENVLIGIEINWGPSAPLRDFMYNTIKIYNSTFINCKHAIHSAINNITIIK